MNVITEITARIEDYRKENKNPCKNYGTEAAAEKAVGKMADMVAEHHACDSQAHYVVFFIEAWGRWVGAIDMNELIRREEAIGGYIGLAASKGFHCY